MRKSFMLPAGKYFIGDPAFVFTNMELWETFQNAVLIKDPSLIEGLDNSELKFWNKLESMLNDSFYAEIDDNKVWASKTVQADKAKYPILGGGMFQTNTREWIVSCSGWIGITPLQKTMKKPHQEHEKLRKNRDYFRRMCVEYLIRDFDNPISVTFDTDIGIFSFDTMEIDAGGRRIDPDISKDFSEHTWKTIKESVESKLQGS